MRYVHILSHRRQWRLALALMVALGAMMAPAARAQGPNIPVPSPPAIPIAVPPPPFLPLNQPIALRYQDAEGPGQITLVNVGPDSTTGAYLLTVTLTQNGNTFNGSGSASVLNATQPYTTVLAFDLIAPWGQSYFFQGRTALTVELTGQGSYHPTGSPAQSAFWQLIAPAFPPSPPVPPPVPPPTPTPGTAGIQGYAIEGPISPVERPGVPNTRPLPYAIITVQPAGGGQEIARGQADASGYFHISLAPGTYLIVPLPPQPGAFLPRGIAQRVTVPPGVFVNITVDYDTGIR